jgi:hypothetical protein
MSYDLYLSGRKLSADEFSSYFSSRPNYKASETQAVYQNDDTGVYFIFEKSRGDEPEMDPDAPRYDVSFNLNYFRAHIFGLEAEPEVRAFIEAYGFSIHDPQNDGMANGPYTMEGFLRGWNAGNEFGYRAFLENPQAAAQKPFAYSAAAIERFWLWNLNRNSIQTQFGEELFVPRIMFLILAGKVASYVVWGDAIPSLIPQVDVVLVPRKQLAPRGLFQKKDDMCLVPFGDVARAFVQYMVRDYNLPALLIPHPESPAAVKDFVRRLRPHNEKLAGISVDKVLDQELVERYRPSH